MLSEPKIEQRPDQHYAAIRANIPMREMPSLPPLWDEVFGWLKSKGITPAGAPLWNYRVIDMEATMEIDVAVPVAAPIEGDGRVLAGVMPAGRYVIALFTGSVMDDGLMRATGDLLAWADKNGVVWDKWQSGATGEGWQARAEIYLTDPDNEPDLNKWETELAFKTADS
jgi:effector-binding domain-containing protein